MAQLGNLRARQAYELAHVRGIPAHVARRASNRIRLVVAARERRDVIFLGAVPLKSGPDRLGIAVHGKWYVTLDWVPGIGAQEIRLERL